MSGEAIVMDYGRGPGVAVGEMKFWSFGTRYIVITKGGKF
jgi:hypothetical protein